jgi:hypothetical protein
MDQDIVKPKRARKPKENQVVVQAKMTKDMAKDYADPKIKSIIRRAHDFEINLISPKEFFKDISRPVESRLYNWMKEVQEKSEEMLDLSGQSRIVEIAEDGKWRWRMINSTDQLREILKKSGVYHKKFLESRQNAYSRMLAKEDSFGGFGFANDGGGNGNSITGLPVRNEYSPLIGTPFFKQMYLYDYWAMHSKCFWYSNYSGIAKLIVDMTRNFVMGKGFNVTFEDSKAQDVWNRYEEISNIQEESRNWCDELTKFGENMLKKVPHPITKVMHKSFDPSTIWEIVTDPENISDVKYYHQQYNTQYQLYGTKDAPISKYIINQLPPELVTHTKINVTSYEKRGRSDLLAPLLYFKYYEDYTQAKLARAKNEAAFIWDVEIDGSDEDVQAYINSTESIVDVPPGSENVHNKSVKRTPLSPTFGKAGADQIAQDILSYVAMATGIPTSYMGTFNGNGGTRAGALVATEPVAKKMLERQQKMETLIRRIVKDVLVANSLDPMKCKFEVNFPEILEEDRSTKIQDLYSAVDRRTLSHETASYIVAKELKITKYDYETEQEKIAGEDKKSAMFMPPSPDSDLTGDGEDGETKPTRALNRKQVKKDGLQL